MKCPPHCMDLIRGELLDRGLGADKRPKDSVAPFGPQALDPTYKCAASFSRAAVQRVADELRRDTKKCSTITDKCARCAASTAAHQTRARRHAGEKVPCRRP